MSRALFRPWRSVAMSLSASASFDDFSKMHVVASSTSYYDQIYTAQAFPYYGVYLAIMMVFNGYQGRIRCELAWSANLTEWKRFRPAKFQTWEAPWHYGRLPFAGRDNDELIPLRKGSYNSHICFAAKPVEVRGEGVRVYFMAGNESHSAARSTSFALAKIRPDGFVGVRSSQGSHGRLVTLPLLVAGSELFVTADFGAEGILRAEVVEAETLNAVAAVPVGELRHAAQVTDKACLLRVAPFRSCSGRKSGSSSRCRT